MNQAQKNYNRVHELSKDIKSLQGISSLLSWDQETVMPSGGGAVRAEHLKVIAGVIHKESTSQKFSSALSKLIDLESGQLIMNDLQPPQKAALKVWRREYLRNTALPRQFVEKFAKLTSEAIHAWNSAKTDNAFSRFSPYLEKIIYLCRQKADYIGFKDHPYDALLDEFEPEITTSELKKIFGHVRKDTVVLLKQIGKKKQVDDTFLYGKFAHKKQWEMSKELLNEMGYCMKRGRLDESIHPFSSSCHPNDSRITTRIQDNFVMSNIRTILHEGGHSLYEMGLPIEAYGSPLGEAASLGVHESQSRWWETRIGHSKGFWKQYLTLLKKYFPNKFDSINLNQFYRGINKVNPSLIRVEADEVTYNMHVILRFEMETALIEGSLNVRDIPEVWNDKMVELLGVCPDSNTTGCLQDIHWSLGMFGYFPTYALGNLFAAHLFETFENEHPDWEKQVSRGHLNFINTWLGKNVHSHGQQYNSLELMKKVTNKSFSPKAFTRYINTKYKDIYSIT